ncbi:HNH endonuclease [Candidatus Pacearchaeota archaeon]|nr:MAG: HNH endonuclease [Candidatus Pacearchaeota archaeon]
MLVLNASYEPLSICTVKRAISLYIQNKAEIIYTYDGKVIKTPSTFFPRPSVIRLNYYVKLKKRLEVPLNKKNILKRDNYTCQYCGKKGGNMTIDHVIPKRKGGKDTWENLVCACPQCNALKGDRTPEEAGMKLLRKPFKPHYILFMFMDKKLPDERWRQFFFS